MEEKEKEEENITIDKADRISQLPESIIHQILSLLHSQEKISQMSVLSKDWFALTSSYPILKFHYNGFRNSSDKFFKHVAYTTSRFCRQNNINAHTFNIYIHTMETTDIDSLDRCLGLILKRGVHVLRIIINYAWYWLTPMYCLPNILLSASSLTSLDISGCKLPSSLMVDVIKFKSLKFMSLHKVPLDEGVIECLTNFSPLLEKFYLKYCYGFNRFCISRHHSLRKVQIYCENGIERIDIEAPNLCYLHFTNNTQREPFMNLASCKKLTTFRYYGFPLQCFTDLSSNIPYIETLILGLPSRSEKLKLSSHSLRRLILNSICDLEKTDINTPNLLLFEYYHSDWYSSFLKNDPTPTHSEACIKYDIVYTRCFQKLRGFLDKNIEFRILKLGFKADYINVEELKVLHSSPSTLDHVEIVPGSNKKLPVLVAVVDAVLWCWRPQSLTLILDGQIIVFKTQYHIVKYTYERLLQQEIKGQITIRIVLSYFSSKQHFSDLNLLLKALPHDYQRYTITFIKEEATSTRRSKRH